MIEVFRTNVGKEKEADLLLGHFHREFPNYRINFDLEDCDKILRIETDTALINVVALFACMKAYGFIAEVLPDEPTILREMKS